MAEELSLEHFDLGTFVDYVYALKQERDALRAQLPSQGGEAVEVVAVAFITRAEKSGPKIAITLKKEDAEKQHKNWLSMSKIITTEPLMTVAQHQRILAALSPPSPDAELVELLREDRELIEHGDFREGHCMCGSAVEAHGFGDGHSPVDAGVYYAGQVMERIDAKMASLKGVEE